MFETDEPVSPPQPAAPEMPKVPDTKWEEYDMAQNATTERLKVEGGYLYYVCNHEAHQTSMCFVPDVDLARYQAHLRDAYNQGYKDRVHEAEIHLRSRVQCAE